MKKFILSLALALTVVFGTVSVGCGGGGSTSTDINVHIYNAGYGIDWLTEMAKDYEDISGQKVNVKSAVDSDTDVTKLQVDKNSYDILFLVTELPRMAKDNHIADLTDIIYNKKIPVYNADGSKNETATNANKTVKEALGNKASSLAYDFNNDGNAEYYTMPFSSSTDGLLYNKVTLDYVFGEDNYTLPRTTAEFKGMLEKIKSSDKNVYGMVSAADYMEYLVDVWWAQYDGVESYMNYWKGYTVDGVKSVDEPLMAKNLSNGRKEALTFLDEIFKPETGYFHENTADFFNTKNSDWVKGQKAFTYNSQTNKGTYYNKKYSIAFYPCGDWFEHEMGAANLDGSDVRVMKVPVISSLGTKLGITEKELSDCVAYVDGDITEKPTISSTLSLSTDEVLAAVESARNIAHSNFPLSVACVPKTCNKIDAVSDFLLYMVSDRGQKIYASYTNGLTMPYGYDIADAIENQADNDKYYIEVSDFVSSYNECFFDNENTTYISRDITKQLAYLGDLASFTTDSNKYTKTIYNGYGVDYVLNETYKSINTRWSSIKGYVGK